MDDLPNDHLIRELYARFGLTYYFSECLHRGLCIILALSKVQSFDMIPRPQMEERLASAFSLTLGDVVKELKGILPAELWVELDNAKEIRNHLAHHFFFDCAHLMFNVENVHQLIAELDRYAKQFECLDSRITEWSESMRRELGLSEEQIRKSMSQIFAGQTDEPLPSRQQIYELKKKLRKSQNLIRVWECILDDGRKPLIFELEDGTFWQLSDIGLCWSRFKDVGSDWIEHPAIQLHLPAKILLRPESAGPWDYEFTLAHGMVLRVKPGNQKRTFKWGIRSP